MTVVGRNWRQGWFECRVEDRVAHVAVYHARAIIEQSATAALNSTEN